MLLHVVVMFLCPLENVDVMSLSLRAYTNELFF
jgi:hypothetical protein